MAMPHLRRLREARSDTFKASAANIAGWAEAAFAEHQLTEQGPWRWRCQKPGSWAYGFYLLISPGAVIIYGDTDDVILRMSEGREESVLSWLRSCCRSNELDYLLGKAKGSELRGFYVGDALRAIAGERSRMKNGSNRYAGFRRECVEVVLASEMHPHALAELAQEHGVDDFYDRGRGWSSGAVWIWHALRCFCRLYAAAQQAEQDSRELTGS